MKIANDGSFMSLSASRNASGLLPVFAGGVCGNIRLKPASRNDAMPESQSESAPPSPGIPFGHVRRIPVSASPAAIHPSVPKTRTRPNLFSASGRWWNVIEFVSASVGA